MISASKEILSYDTSYQRYSSDEEEYKILSPSIWHCRTHISICKVCKDVFRNPGPQETKNKIMCFFCSSEIEQKSFEFYDDLRHKKLIFQKKMSPFLKEIKEIGMHPSRIYQTQLFEYYIFMDLKKFVQK